MNNHALAVFIGGTWIAGLLWIILDLISPDY